MGFAEGSRALRTHVDSIASQLERAKEVSTQIKASVPTPGTHGKPIRLLPAGTLP